MVLPYLSKKKQTFFYNGISMWEITFTTMVDLNT